MLKRLDVRDLEPPQPLLEVLKAIEEMEEGDTLEVLGRKPFVNLLPRLDEMGYIYSLEKRPEGYLLSIRKA